MNGIRRLKDTVRESDFYLNYIRPLRDRDAESVWIRRNRPVPTPHVVKARNLMTVADLFHLDVLVETGTYRGDMVYAMRDRFRLIRSIEILPQFAQAAAKRFRSHLNIEIIAGDSAVELSRAINGIDEGILFWFDGHYSGEGTGRGHSNSPILQEIEQVERMRRCGRDAILIDDACAFTGEGGYPRLEIFVRELKQRLGKYVTVADDCIFCIPIGQSQGNSGGR